MPGSCESTSFGVQNISEQFDAPSLRDNAEISRYSTCVLARGERDHGVFHDEGAMKAILATTAYFSKEAKLIFERNPWKLGPKEFDGIKEWIERYLNCKNT
jgi:hypothetical protein